MEGQAINRRNIFLTAFGVLIITFLGSIAAVECYKDCIRAKIKAEQLAKRKEIWTGLNRVLEGKVAGFNGTASVIIRDLGCNDEIAFNKGVLIPAASLVKVPIMLACFYAAQDGKIALSDKVYLKGYERVAGSKVLGSVPAGSAYTVEELLDPMITQSDNTATNMLIDLLGFDTLNAYFKKMGLKNTNIARRMLDFKERNEGEENYTTAEDMARALEQLYNENFLSKEVSQRCLGLLAQQKINDRIPRRLPRGTLVAHKTGLERHVCHDVGIVYTDKGNFLICVLARHDNRHAKPTKRFISDVTLLTYNCYINFS